MANALSDVIRTGLCLKVTWISHARCNAHALYFNSCRFPIFHYCLSFAFYIKNVLMMGFMLKGVHR